MNSKVLVLTVLASSVSGCASSLKTFTAPDMPTPGIPIYSPVLVKITERSTFKAISGTAVDQMYCTDETIERLEFLPLGERSYIAFEAPAFGKGEFKLEFSDAGVLKSVSVNSDATAGLEQVAGLLATAIPVLGAPQGALGESKLGGQEKPDKTAQAKKDELCMKEGTVVDAVKIVEIEKAAS